MRKQNKIILWSTYFDSTKSWNEGRRVPKKLAVSSPKLQELQRAAQKAGIQSEAVPDVAHPATPWKDCGQLIVPKTEPKGKIVKKIAKALSDSRK
jgi:signal recognition particle subunit SRP19